MKPVTLNTRQLLGYRIVTSQTRCKLGGKIGNGKPTATMTQAAKIGSKLGVKDA